MLACWIVDRAASQSGGGRGGELKGRERASEPQGSERGRGKVERVPSEKRRAARTEGGMDLCTVVHRGICAISIQGPGVNAQPRSVDSPWGHRVT